MIPQTSQELDSTLSIMQNRGASQQDLQTVYDAYKQQKAERIKTQAPNVMRTLGTINKVQEQASQGKYEEVQPYKAQTDEEKMKGVMQTTKPVTDTLAKVGDFTSNLGASAVSKVAETAGNIAKASDIINPVAWEAKLMGKGEDTFGTQTQKGADWLAKQPLEVQEKLGTNKSMAGKAGQITGEVLGTVAGEVPALATGSELLRSIKAIPEVMSAIQKYPKLAALIEGATKSVGSTEIITAGTEGRAASPTELAGYGALDAALFGIGKLGGEVYKSAFKGTKGEEKNFINQFDKTIADAATELGYSGTEKSIKTQAQTAGQTIWKQIEELAKTNKVVTRKEFIETITPKLLKNVDKLPKGTVRNEMTKIIEQTVKDYAPSVSASGTQLIESIKNLNKGLFGEGTRTVLNPKQAKSIESQLKNGIKDLLPENIKPLYEDYSKNKIIEKVMADARVQKLLGRSLLGGAAGGISGASAGYATGQDPLNIAKTTIAGILIGSLGARATANVGLKTVGGKVLSKTPTTASLVKMITESIIQKLNPESEVNQ